MPNASTNTMWKLGDHRLLLGDAAKAKDIAQLLGKEKANLLLTDPPYGVGYVEGKQELLGTAHKNNTKKFSVIAGDALEDDYYDFSKRWLQAVRPYLSLKNSFYIFNGDTKLRELLNALHNNKYSKAALLIWIKNHPVIGRKDYYPQHELILYGWYGKHEFFGQKDKTALFYPKPHRNLLHPTMKPPALLRRLIYHSSRPGDLILDPFGGSGSTLIACEQLGRRCFLIEQDESYCQTILERWQKLTKGKVELLT